MSRPFNVLFLCTGNSARSIMAEALLNHMGGGRFRAFSAGSHPAGAVNPYALRQLARMNISAEGVRSKSWDEFAGPGAPAMDFVFTVCDNAAGEVCPIWPGAPVSAHWGIEDPAAAEGDDAVKISAFQKAFRLLEARLRIFSALPIARLDRERLIAQVREIGQLLPDGRND
jgi:arsenate reductase